MVAKLWKRICLANNELCQNKNRDEWTKEHLSSSSTNLSTEAEAEAKAAEDEKETVFVPKYNISDMDFLARFYSAPNSDAESHSMPNLEDPNFYPETDLDFDLSLNFYPATDFKPDL